MFGLFNMMSGCFHRIMLIVLACTFLSQATAEAARIKDIAAIQGVRPNQLFGYGLVIGLNGSGDKNGTSFTIQGLANMLEKMGIHVSTQDIKVSNVAAVMVSATLPPFARIGKKIDILLSSIGDAKTLQGGTLLLTPLTGVDGKVYALAQGPISVGGFSAGGSAGGGVTKNHPTVGRITDGATVEREIPLSLEGKKELVLILNNPDFNTAKRMADAIDLQFGEKLAKPLDSGTLDIRIPERFENQVVSLIAELGNLEMEPDTIARVVVNEKTGTVIIGDNVSISQVAVAHGNLSIQIEETKEVSQPQPFGTSEIIKGSPAMITDSGVVIASGGATVVTPKSDVNIHEEKTGLMLVPEGKTVGDLVKALNAIGVTPRDLITILQTMKTAGALQAELEIM